MAKKIFLKNVNFFKFCNIYYYKVFLKIMKKVVRLTESDLHKLIKRSVNKILKEDAADYYFGWMDDKDYSQFDDDERRDLEQELDFRDSRAAFLKDFETNDDWREKEKHDRVHGIKPYDGDYQLSSLENQNVHDYHGAFGQMAQSDDYGDRAIAQNANLFKSIKEATNEALKNIMKEAYVGSLKKKIYGQNPNETSAIEIYDDGKNRTHKNVTYQNTNHLSDDDIKDIKRNINESLSDSVKPYNIITIKNAEKFGFTKNQYNPFSKDTAGDLELWVNLKMNPMELKTLPCRPFFLERNNDGKTVRVGVVVKPRDMKNFSREDFFAKMRSKKEM